MLAVPGNGHGHRDARRFFEPFFTTKAETKGTGLGLATVLRHRAASGRRHTSSNSEVGRGTTFRIYFPVVTAPTSEATTPPLADQASPGEVVLVVEDESEVLAVAARALREAGYIVMEALNGRAALDLLERHAGRLDLVVTDVAMPVLNGRELADAVRQRYPTVPVLFMSGQASGEAAEPDLGVAGRMLLQKPFSPDRLTAQVRALLDQHRTGGSSQS